jgi:hypothetical protein
MAKITKVPNGHLIKKDGTSLRKGGVVKKAQVGDSIVAKKPYVPGRATPEQRAAAKLKREKNAKALDSTFEAHASQSGMTKEEYSKMLAKRNRKPDVPTSGLCTSKSDGGKGSCTTGNRSEKRTVRNIRKNGGMIKRADGSYSKRGLWDNIRANKGSGKKPTKQMLIQEKKIKAKSKK